MVSAVKELVGVGEDAEHAQKDVGGVEAQAVDARAVEGGEAVLLHVSVGGDGAFGVARGARGVVVVAGVVEGDVHRRRGLMVDDVGVGDVAVFALVADVEHPARVGEPGQHRPEQLVKLTLDEQSAQVGALDLKSEAVGVHLEVDRRHDRAEAGAGQKARDHLRAFGDQEADGVALAHAHVREQARELVHLGVKLSPGEGAGVAPQRRGVGPHSGLGAQGVA